MHVCDLTCINLRMMYDFVLSCLSHNFQMSLCQVGTNSQSLVEILQVVFDSFFNVNNTSIEYFNRHRLFQSIIKGKMLSLVESEWKM